MTEAPPLTIRVTFRNDNPATIWNRLAARLGREPTDEEASYEVRRILNALPYPPGSPPGMRDQPSPLRRPAEMADDQSVKTTADHFRDWEGTAFGFGYGTGEPVIIPVVKTFLAAFGRDDSLRAYDYAVLERAVGAPAAWLLINRFCQLNAIEYGTSPRYGWLTARGERLQDYFASKTADEILDDLVEPEDYHGCYPDHCNCDGPGKCVNPFWTDAALPAPPAAIKD